MPIMTTNPFRRSNGRREPAVPFEPVIDPAGWCPGDITATESWRYVLSDTEIAEIDAAVAAVEEIVTSPTSQAVGAAAPKN